MNIVRLSPFGEFGPGLDWHAPAMLAALRQSDRRADRDGWKPPVDIHETADSYRLDVELPAVDPKDVRVELHKGVLKISGERVGSLDGKRLHQRERRYGKFWRGFHLPEDADPTAIHATARHGVLSITVGKRADDRPRAIAVEAA